MKYPILTSILLVALILLSGALVVTNDATAHVASGSDEPLNPCEEGMGGAGDWAIFHVWCFSVEAATDIEKFAKDDILKMEAQCPGTQFIKGETIRREGSDAILYKTEPNSKYGPIFVAYYKSHCGIERQLCRAGNEKAGSHAYSFFLDNVRGKGLCIEFE